MRAVLIEVPEELIRERRRLGLDEFDEMWEGELHMSPLPHWDHQGLEQGLTRFFLLHWADLGEGVFRAHVGVKPPGTSDIELAGELVPRNYRGPDLAFLLEGSEGRVEGGWVVGPPDAVIEIRSPGDETYKKFPFYHSLGVREVIVIHRDTRAVEVHARGREEYERVAPSPDGSVASRVLDTVFRAEATASGAIALHLHRAKSPEHRVTI